MILGQYKPYYYNLKMYFGQYCQVYEKTRNNMTPKSVGGTALIPKNYRGSYYFVSLKTGRRVHARQWNILHITESVIGMAEQLAPDEEIN